MIWFLFFMLGVANQTELYSGPIRWPGPTPPNGIAVKVSEYITIDGKRVGIQEWSDK